MGKHLVSEVTHLEISFRVVIVYRVASISDIEMQTIHIQILALALTTWVIMDKLHNFSES